jgi:hypothetical protein
LLIKLINIGFCFCNSELESQIRMKNGALAGTRTRIYVSGSQYPFTFHDSNIENKKI